jgi:hypothetical protein
VESNPFYEDNPLADRGFVPVECACDTCQGACSRVPCWPTPEQVESLLDHGYEDSLQMVRRSRHPHSSWVDVVYPATEGTLEGGMVYWWGSCVFLTEEGQCSLHDAVDQHGRSMKPLEGRLASCQSDRDGISLRDEICRLWDTPKGIAIAKRFKELRPDRVDEDLVL